MTDTISQLSPVARNALRTSGSETVTKAVNGIIRPQPSSADGYFLIGLCENAAKWLKPFRYAFEKELELEDLECRDESFEYCKQGGDAATSIANYGVKTDFQIIDKIIEVCSADRTTENTEWHAAPHSAKTPVFVVGLPRTTASSAQIRNKGHSSSVHKWKRYARQLQILMDHLESAGISVE